MKNFRRRTVCFLLFMAIFLSAAGYLTYYSHVVYLQNLPTVELAVPQPTGEYENGRDTYVVPADSLYHDEVTGVYFILAARYTSDALGERFIAVRVNVWVLEETDEGCRVDGIVWGEPVIVGAGDTVKAGDAIRYK